MRRANDTPPTRPRPAALPRQLADAYRRAVYVVFGPDGPFEVAVGRRCSPLERLLDRCGATQAALLTAANPGSKRLTERTNRLRTRALAVRIAEGGWSVLPGESRSAAGDWREPSFLVLGIDEEAARALARGFGQAALLFVTRGAKVKLEAV
jgi:hypothetical protein